MLPSSHIAPINSPGPEALPSTRMLADAFSEFIFASSQLEASYRDLQHEVAHLGVELAERNGALSRSLAENCSMRSVLQQMIDSMPCGVLVLGVAQSILTINPEARRLLDLGDAQVSTLRQLSAIAQIDFARLMAGSEDDLDREICISSGGAERWLAIGNRKFSSMAPSHADVDGKGGLQSIWVLRDVTASKQAEAEREAARSAMALAEISTVLAHEIRNPLASMELFAGLIQEDGMLAASEQGSQWIDNLLAGIRLLSGTVNNVLSIHSGSTPLLAAINLTACVHSGVEFVRPIVDQAGMSLSFASGDEATTILGNEDSVRQIILNMICNAIRHTPTGGEISVSVSRLSRQDGSQAVVEITDTGCGIPEDAIQHIFKTGYSADGNTSGLGLAVCKRLMTQHSGDIRVASRINHGSTFSLEFPAL